MTQETDNHHSLGFRQNEAENVVGDCHHFGFLMGGVATNYTELGALWTTIGKRTVLWILLVTLPMVLGVGLLLNLLR